jgi:hypothetical protein
MKGLERKSEWLYITFELVLLLVIRGQNNHARISQGGCNVAATERTQVTHPILRL